MKRDNLSRPVAEGAASERLFPTYEPGINLFELAQS
jgi:hypothetical protein